MYRLTGFELGKIWGKQGFVLSVIILVVLNGFLLWYTNLPDGETPALSSYKMFLEDISGMSEQEKEDYVAGLKEKMDGVSFVQEILAMKNSSGEMAEALAEQSLNSNPGLFEKWYDVYRSGQYLKYTESLWEEKTMVDELYEEQQKVSAYDAYLQSVREAENTLSGISIFGGQKKDTFSEKNIRKSARDYAVLGGDGICWMPSKPLKISMENVWTDLFLLLSVFLFTGNLVMEEKAKKLFYITRAAKYGWGHSAVGKAAALFLHCMAMSFLLYGVNLLFCLQAAGFGDLSAPLQSVSMYMESVLPVSIRAYILLSIATKGLVMFAAGTILLALCIASANAALPFAAGILFWGMGYVLYYAVPAGGKGALFKYLNPAGLLKTENMYGSYLNFNIFGTPVSRMTLSWSTIVLLAVAGITLSLVFFIRGTSLELADRHRSIRRHFRPHAGLIRHECYKIMVTNKAALILIIFAVFMGGRLLMHQYRPSAREQYYQELMMQLEGELTEEKENMILSEQNRFQEAFDRIDEIDQMIADGEISQETGEDMKSKWYQVTAFYPSFHRILQQYDSIRENEENSGKFIYDTGYLYLLGAGNVGRTGNGAQKDFPVDLLLLSLGVILAFSNVIPMEYEKGTWKLLSVTKEGRKNILLRNGGICLCTSAVFSLVPFLCRAVGISQTYPLHGWGFSVNNIPYCSDFPLPVPVVFYIFLLVLAQAASVMIITLVVLVISAWRKNHIQTVFFAILVLAVPLILKLLGFSFAGWFSVYTLYSWTTE
ncbi:MAG: hypothetical protein SOW08_07625 [Lachnospiraceae bacterium]|nr:hypothetical protein [Lachnospiraceae bacterium]